MCVKVNEGYVGSNEGLICSWYLDAAGIVQGNSSDGGSA